MHRELRNVGFFVSKRVLSLRSQCPHLDVLTPSLTGWMLYYIDISIDIIILVLMKRLRV